MEEKKICATCKSLYWSNGKSYCDNKCEEQKLWAWVRTKKSECETIDILSDEWLVKTFKQEG